MAERIGYFLSVELTGEDADIYRFFAELTLQTLKIAVMPQGDMIGSIFSLGLKRAEQFLNNGRHDELARLADRLLVETPGDPAARLIEEPEHIMACLTLDTRAEQKPSSIREILCHAQHDGAEAIRFTFLLGFDSIRSSVQRMTIDEMPVIN